MFTKSIALVHDEINLVNIYSEILQMSGYTVHKFTDSGLAYDYLKENLDKFSLLITDYRMPNLNGMLLAMKILEINKNINVIILVNDHDDIECNYKFNIIKKPISIPKLLRLVNESVSLSMSGGSIF
ncbi:MAG: response regulator [Nitrososphaeraceae archaeon]